MIKKKTDVWDIILNIILTLLAILVIYWLIKLLLGGSPGLSEFNFSLIILITGFLIKIYRETGEVKTGMRHSFIKIRDDMNLIRNDINLIKNKLKINKNNI